MRMVCYLGGDDEIEFEGRGSTEVYAKAAVIDSMIELRDKLTVTIAECINL